MWKDSALTCMVEVMVGVEVAMVDMVVAWPGDMTVGRGEATVLGISILLLVAAWTPRLGGFCFTLCCCVLSLGHNRLRCRGV